MILFLEFLVAASVDAHKIGKEGKENHNTSDSMDKTSSNSQEYHDLSAKEIAEMLRNDSMFRSFRRGARKEFDQEFKEHFDQRKNEDKITVEKEVKKMKEAKKIQKKIIKFAFILVLVFSIF